MFGRMMKNQLSGLTRKEKDEAKSALVLAGRLQWWKKLRAEGKEKRAAEYAATYKFEGLVAEELAKLEKEAEAASVKEEVLLDELIANAQPPLAEDMAALEKLGVPMAPMRSASVMTSEEIREIRQGEPVTAISIDGWPQKCEAEVYRYPRNPRMVVIRLDDGREARLWNDGMKRRKLGARVKVKLETGGEEAVYVGDFGE